MKRSTKLITRALPPSGFAAILYYLSSLPSPDPPTLGLAGEDKLLHAGAYCLLTLSVVPFAMEANRGSIRRAEVWAFLFGALYGLSDELHQALVPGRSCDPLDWIADLIGAVLAIAFVRWLDRSGRLTTRRADTPVD